MNGVIEKTHLPGTHGEVFEERNWGSDRRRDINEWMKIE